MLKGNKRMMRGYFADGDLERFSRFDTCFGYNMMNSPFTWVSMLFHVLLVIAFIVLVVYIVKHIWNQPGKKVEAKLDVLAIIKERYARGEITKEEFELLKKDLT